MIRQAQAQALPLIDNLSHQIYRLSSLNPFKATLSQTTQAHAFILKAGFLKQSDFTTKLLSLYANHQSFSDAYFLLSSIPEPDFFSFSTLINAASKFNQFQHVLNLLAKMFAFELFPDAHIVPSAIKACAGLSALKVGKQVHGFCLSSGLVVDSFVESSLLHMYVKFNVLKEARNVFDTMTEPNVVSWSALASGYAKKGDVENALGVFDKMGELGVEPNMVSWNGMISGFNQSGHCLDAILMFRRMHANGVKGDEVSVSSVLSAVGDVENLSVGVQVHCYGIKHGVGSDNSVASSLLDMYSKSRVPLAMLQVFGDMDYKDVCSCNALVAGLSRNGMVDEALRSFRKFQVQGIDLNVVSWTSILACCSQNGKDFQALKFFGEMQKAGVQPNSLTLACVLPACANITALTHGKAAHCFSLRRGYGDDVYVGSALIDMYSNCGRIVAAKRCFDKLPVLNLACWNAMIGAYAMHGMPKEAINVFHLMQSRDQKPDCVTFTSLLSACSQGGLADLGRKYFNSMSKDYGIEPMMEHYACMVSVLGRAGKLEEAYSMIKEMPFDADSCVWGAFLNSCRVHRNMILAEVAANRLFELEPENSGNYVLLSNVYASKGLWSEVDKVRDTMKDLGLKKTPGCSWIEVKNKVHMLLAGDKSHPQILQILEKQNELAMEMKRAGYLPDTEFVLQNVEEQEKEHILCGHSEKLAVVLGIINTSPGTSLTVMKNLRICGDCHAVIKFISAFEKREIFVRDTNRFHHFKQGVCSCGEMW